MFRKSIDGVFIIGVAAALLLGLTGCRSSRIEMGTGSTEAEAARHVAGEVVSVNNEFGYLIVRCAIPPPPDMSATVYRKGEIVGRVRFSDRSSPPYVSADILSGNPQRGDLVLY